LLVASVAVAAAVAVSGGIDAQAQGLGVTHAHGKRGASHASHANSNEPHVISRSQLRFRNDMRKLWEDHITWTRLAIISLIADTPDTQATVGRLLRNQVDIGDAIKPFYGDAAGTRLTELLRQHILIAADLVNAAKAGDQAGAADAQARWLANADEIAAFLNRANPRFWKLDEMQSMMRDHLRLTADEAVARLQQNWDADIAAYDAIHVQALGMAEMLSTGIIRQFRARFR
jgi:hypothetical protein